MGRKWPQANGDVQCLTSVLNRGYCATDMVMRQKRESRQCEAVACSFSVVGQLVLHHIPSTLR